MNASKWFATATLALAVAVSGNWLAAGSAWAQRGVGDPSGVARAAVRPPLVEIEGVILGIETGPCQNTTGRGRIGTHLIVETPDQEQVNLHLGWAQAVIVEKLVAHLSAGDPIQATAFRTKRMPEGAYVAQRVETKSGAAFVLRDERLRPVWADSGRRGGFRRPGRGVGRLGPF